MKQFLIVSLCGMLVSMPAMADWYFLSRHGECSSMTQVMRHKLPDLPEVRTPEEAVDALRAQGLEASLKSPPDGGNSLVLIEVPAHGWSLLAVVASRCSSFGGAK